MASSNQLTIRQDNAPSIRESVSSNDAYRMRKHVSQNAKTIQNRIKFFKREEDKIWKGLEDVRRQASKIEDGRTRMLEKKLADKTVMQRRQAEFYEKKMTATEMKSTIEEQKRCNMADLANIRREQGEIRKRESQECYRTKHMIQQQQRLKNAERVVQIQRDSLEAKLRANQERSERLQRVRTEQEFNKRKQETEADFIESQIPMLEEEEMRCLQRLQNSRIVTQSVLSELEGSLGVRNPVTNMLRNKAFRSQSIIEESVIDLQQAGVEDASELDAAFTSVGRTSATGPDTPGTKRSNFQPTTRSNIRTRGSSQICPLPEEPPNN